jgi:hypothetical protein
MIVTKILPEKILVKFIQHPPFIYFDIYYLPDNFVKIRTSKFCFSISLS